MRELRIYTIGFAGRSAESFFAALEAAGVREVVDIRLRPSGQLAGFARKQDLPFFLERLVPGCGYRHLPVLAPTADILQGYRRSKDWLAYVRAFEQLMDDRKVPEVLRADEFDGSCLLCSEREAERCHRSLVARRMSNAWPGTRVIHL